MKAVSLPVNSLIILVLALIVLTAIFGIFSGSMNIPKASVSLDAATRAACQAINPISCRDAYRAARTAVYNFDANKNGQTNNHAVSPTGCTDVPDGIICYGQDNFEMLCYNYYNGPAGFAVKYDANWQIFVNTCMVDICKCPKYPFTGDNYVG